MRNKPQHSPHALPSPPPPTFPIGPPGPPAVLRGYHRLRVALRFSTGADVGDVCEAGACEIGRLKYGAAYCPIGYESDPPRSRRKPGDSDTFGSPKPPGVPIRGVDLLRVYLVKLGHPSPQPDLDAVCDTACDLYHDLLSQPSGWMEERGPCYGPPPWSAALFKV